MYDKQSLFILMLGRESQLKCKFKWRQLFSDGLVSVFMCAAQRLQAQDNVDDNFKRKRIDLDWKVREKLIKWSQKGAIKFCERA